MPYRTEGGVKFTDHHLQSPLHNVANSFAICHRWSEREITARVESTQDKIHEARGRAEESLAKAHLDVASAMEAGAKDEELAGPRKQIRHGPQLKWDYVAASNGMGFHSPAEALGFWPAQSINPASAAGMCRILARHGYTKAVAYPDYGTKEKAQAAG